MIQIWIDGRCFGPKGSGFAVKMLGGVSWVRTVSCAKLTTNQTEIKALEYALLSIAPAFQADKIEIISSGKYAVLMLEKRLDQSTTPPSLNWARKPANNPALIGRIREIYSRFKDISIRCEEDETVEMLKTLNEKAVKKRLVVFDRK